jgi:uncharacterized membrane protein
MKKEKKIYKVKNDKYSEYFEHKQSPEISKTISILPHPTTLESYEEVSPGITEKLGVMIVKEQEHRHKIEMRKIKNITSIYRFGQLLSSILAVLMIYATILIYDEYGSEMLAAVVCFCGFSFLTIINVVSMKNFKVQKEQPKHFKKKRFYPKKS